MRKIFLSIPIIMMVTGCGPVTPYPISAFTATSLPTTTSTPIVAHLELRPITAEKLDSLQRLDTWGKGNIYDIALAPDGGQIAVYSSMGVYIYDLNTLAETK